jgi:hypothetical protein
MCRDEASSTRSLTGPGDLREKYHKLTAEKGTGIGKEITPVMTQSPHRVPLAR